MAQQGDTLWLHSAQSQDAPGACGSTGAAAACGSAPLHQAFGQPALVGEAGELARVMHALHGVPFATDGTDLVDAGQVRGLYIAGGEAELTLAFPRGCGALRLVAEQAFQVLRQVLPDTDIYVRHAP